MAALLVDRDRYRRWPSSAKQCFAFAAADQTNDARRCISEAMKAIETTKERVHEAEVNRITGEIALVSPQREASNAQAYFKRGLCVARQQQAKSWELRAAMSMARLWRGQGKVQQARELLAPVYGWFTERLIRAI
jgi:predicted ATPase